MLKFAAAPLAIAILAGLAVAMPSKAEAGIEYPWCALYGERAVGATNCGFSTFAQCQATVSGLGGLCQENPAYPAVAPRPRPHRSHRAY